MLSKNAETFCLLWFFSSVGLFRFATSLTIETPECNPPDFPAWGGYGPRQDSYVVGDIIHYYCDSDTYIGGNWQRICEDTGDWTGDTPVCDASTEIAHMNQTSSATPEEENNAEMAHDGIRSTCSSTANGNDAHWMGIFKQPGELIRVMVFMPQGEIAYEVILLKENGETLSCGIRRDGNARMGWSFHNCPGPNNRNAIGVKIKSLTSKPLKICEIAAHVLTTPTCVDPHLQIDNGRLQLTRKTASLVCDVDFTRSPATRIECIRDGVWNRKSLYCLEQPWEVSEREGNRPPPPRPDTERQDSEH